MVDKRDEREPADFQDHARPRSLEELRAHELRADPGHETAGRVGWPAEGVLVQVCEVCGKEYTFDTEEPPADLQCERCGNQVFRSFFDVPLGDDVEQDIRDVSERDLGTDDPAPDVTPADLRDLDNI
jgi:DNA-directed RNA polymerase subunit RPC12/RpoP